MEKAARSEYIKALSSQSYVPLYAESWWLDATCGQNGWQIWSVKGEHGRIDLPFQYSKIRGMNTVSNPPFTQFLPLIKSGQINEIPTAGLLQALPAYSILDITLKDAFLIERSSFPKAQLRYSYVINPGEGIDIIRSRFNTGLRRRIKEAAENYELTESDDIETLVKLCNATYHAKGLKAPSWIADALPAVTLALKSNNRGKMKMAWHKGEAIAGILTGWDDKTRYYLAGGRIASDGGSSAHSLLLDDAIADAVMDHQHFDFEGSMHPGIALFFQSFGGIPQSLWRIRSFRGLGRIWSLFHS